MADICNNNYINICPPLSHLHAPAYVECTLYGEERWRGAIRDLKDGMEEYEIIKGYRVRTEKKKKTQ